jgi:hypothetical protein
MKTLALIFFIVMVTLTATIVSAQDVVTEVDPQQSVISSATEGFKTFLDRIDWIYLIIFVVAAWLINDFTDANNLSKWLDWLQKWPKALRTFLLGLVLIPIVGYFNYSTVRDEYFNLLLSLVFGMVLYKMGLNYLFGIISSRVFGIIKKE